MLGTEDKDGGSAYRRDLRQDHWKKWLRAQREAATPNKNGYRQHTPESIWLCRQGQPILAVEWSLPMEITYVRGQG